VGKLLISIAACAGALLASRPAAASTVGAVASLKGQREHKILGVGLVVGLKGTGDKARETQKRIAMLLKRLKFNPDPSDLASKNIAMVFVTAKIRSDIPKGKTIDVAVSSMSDATSLAGGRLLPTPLGTDNTAVVFARAQGRISIAAGGHTTAGTITGGATVEKEIPSKALERFYVNSKGARVRCVDLLLHPNKAGFQLANEIAGNINIGLRRPKDAPVAKALGSTQVRVEVPEDRARNLVDFVQEILNMPVVDDPPAKVVIDESEGTVTSVGKVRISPVTIAAAGRHIVISKEETLENLQEVEGMFNRVRNPTTNTELITIIKALEEAGALQAKLVVK